MKYLFYLAFASLLISSSCADDPVRPIDPCAGAKPFKADFTVYEQLWYDSLFVADTFLRGNEIHFKANDIYDSYKWKVGDDTTIYYTKEFSLRFQDLYGTLPVTLIATKKTNLTCFPNDKSIDTITKYITVAPYEKSALIGNFRGVSTINSKDTFTISIVYSPIKNENGGTIANLYLMKNFNNGCLDPEPIAGFLPDLEVRAGYKHFKFSGTKGNKGCTNRIGYANLVSYNKLEIEYKVDLKGGIIYYFIGERQ
ncbi:MAG: hypothetical protein NTW25_03015 [Candidatus Kapabacteria bacterium]|nr:hypothetical protein [Candidatus Kapabacteria bacterium]